MRSRAHGEGDFDSYFHKRRSPEQELVSLAKPCAGGPGRVEQQQPAAEEELVSRSWSLKDFIRTQL
jgi:hypothetical protein